MAHAHGPYKLKVHLPNLELLLHYLHSISHIVYLNASDCCILYKSLPTFLNADVLPEVMR